MSLLGNAKALVSELEFAQRVRNKLTSVRFVHESDEDTFERVLRLAAERLCSHCRGYGRMASGPSCTVCKGEGVLAVVKPEST